MRFKPGHNLKTNGQLGKISTLPPYIRNEVSRRLDYGHSMRGIAAWLNTQEEVRKIMDERWDGQSVNPLAIACWRDSGHREWRREHQQIDRLKELSEYALKLGQAAGGSVADGSAAIAGGRIMEALETTSDDEIHKMVHSICELRASDIRRVQAAQKDKRLAQHDQKLELEQKRYQRQTAQVFIEWYKDQRAREILESRDNNAEKLERLGRAIFGEDW
jgi:hypothetical protein